LNKKIVAALLIVLCISVAIVAVLYYGNLNRQASYTVEGTLTYAPWHAVTPGITVSSVTPMLSPMPSSLTWLEPKGQGGGFNYTVDAFMEVNFNGNLICLKGFRFSPLGLARATSLSFQGSWPTTKTTIYT